MRVILTGSRTWMDANTLRAALDTVASSLATEGIPMMTLVHGACPNGADELGDQWVRFHEGEQHVTAERHPALWRKFGKRAGFIRNELMVSRGASLCLVFLAPCADKTCTDPKPHGSHGATHCAELADGAGIPIRLFRLGEPGVEALDGRHLADEDVLP